MFGCDRQWSVKIVALGRNGSTSRSDMESYLELDRYWHTYDAFSWFFYGPSRIPDLFPQIGA